MDLLDPEIREEFITHILSILPPSQRIIPREFLDEFIFKITESEDNQDQFPISIEEMSHWLGVKYWNIRRLLDPASSKKSFYVENIDWAKKTIHEVKTHHRKNDVFLSLDCFKNLCLRMNGEKANMIRTYFIIVERAYREWFGNTSYERRKCENSEDTKEKMENITDDYDQFPVSPLAYADKFTQRGIDYTKIGHTSSLPIRFSQLKYTYPGTHQVENYQEYSHPQSIEECAHALAEPARVPCEGHPCPREVYFSKDIDTKAMFESCKEGMNIAKKKYSEKMKAMGVNRIPEPKKKSTLIFKSRKGVVRDLSKEFKEKS
jgi:phage anti-repressor protein